MDRIAQEGLRYNRVFSIALCSPTRAALITGRNHHSADFGVISEQSTSFPGYNSIIAKDKATVGAANPDSLNNHVLELFDLNMDFSQSENVAAKNPKKVKEMKQMFVAEAKKHQVFPRARAGLQ